MSSELPPLPNSSILAGIWVNATCPVAGQGFIEKVRFRVGAYEGAGERTANGKRWHGDHGNDGCANLGQERFPWGRLTKHRHASVCRAKEVLTKTSMRCGEPCYPDLDSMCPET